MALADNRRKFFRIKLRKPLCAQLRIKRVQGEQVNTGATIICIRDIGPGGLRFATDLSFPVKQGVILEFTFRLIERNIELDGCLVRKEIRPGRSYEYGVSFTNMSETKRSDLINLLLTMAVRLKKGVVLNSCSLCGHYSSSCWNSSVIEHV